jgi:phospho-N-acetylmuramoyl-pentapeptide-transferase
MLDQTIIVEEKLVIALLLGLAGVFLATLLTPFYTKFAFKYQLWKRPRSNSTTGESASVYQKLHAKKHERHIPTMAGLIALVTVTLITLIFNLDRNQTWLPLAATVGAGLVGLLDDTINILEIKTKTQGLSARIKFLLISTVALAGGLYSYFKLNYYTAISIPFVEPRFELGIWFVLVFAFVVVATANAVNISDGLDGLAGGLLVSAFTAYAIIAFLQHNYGIAGFCLTMVGALISYTWFNIFPARFFMGDVGSFAFGTALGVVAMLTDTMMLLPIIGFVFVIETGSSGLQIFSKKVFKKKIFRSAPIHHHFEAIGWPEPKVTMRFWLIGQLAATMGILIALFGGHI